MVKLSDLPEVPHIPGPDHETLRHRQQAFGYTLEDLKYILGPMGNLGEEAIGRMWEKVLLPLFAWRYEKFDIDKYPWDEGLEVLMTVACEAMRGHLSGPERTGDFELVETDDRGPSRHRTLGVVGDGGDPQADGRGVRLLGQHQVSQQAGGAVDADHEHAGGHRVEGARVADLPDAQQASDPRDDLV